MTLKLRGKSDGWGIWTGMKSVIGLDQNTLYIVIKHSKYLFTNNKVFRFIPSFYSIFHSFLFLFYFIQLPFFSFAQFRDIDRKPSPHLTFCPFSLLSFSPGLMQVSNPHSWLCNNRIRLKFCIPCSCIDRDIHFLPILQLIEPAETRFTL